MTKDQVLKHVQNELHQVDMRLRFVVCILNQRRHAGITDHNEERATRLITEALRSIATAEACVTENADATLKLFD